MRINLSLTLTVLFTLSTCLLKAQGYQPGDKALNFNLKYPTEVIR